MNIHTKDNHFMAGYGPSFAVDRKAGSKWSIKIGRGAKPGVDFQAALRLALQEISQTYSSPVYLVTGRSLDPIVLNCILQDKLRIETATIKDYGIDFDQFCEKEFFELSQQSRQTSPTKVLTLALAARVAKDGKHPIFTGDEMNARFRNFSWRVDFGEECLGSLIWARRNSISCVPHLLLWSPELIATLMCDKIFAQFTHLQDVTVGSFAQGFTRLAATAPKKSSARAPRDSETVLKIEKLTQAALDKLGRAPDSYEIRAHDLRDYVVERR